MRCSRDDIRKGLAVLESGDWDYVFSATAFVSPVSRSFHRHPTGELEMFFPEHFQTRSQDLPIAMHDAGQFYWGRPEAWLAQAPIFSDRATVVDIPPWRVQDIDTEEDWLRAELLADQLGFGGPPPPNVSV